jgi:Uma2 family endonuclease
MTAIFPIDSDRSFPDSDGKPMAENTEQFRWIVTIKENLEILFADRDDVFIAGDLLWYPIRTRLIAPVAPDAMVVFGRPKGRRGSYKQWQEENIPPQVVFEILSPSNNAEEMSRKLEFYETYGVSEYYLYDPDSFRLEGWRRENGHLNPIWEINGWVSPLLQIRFDLSRGELEIYRPDGRKFLTSVELEQRAATAELLCEQEQQKTELERQRAELEYQRAEQESQRAERLAEYLRSLGVDPDTLPNS